MSKLEPPVDVAVKVLGVLKPEARPFGVFLFHRVDDAYFFVKIKKESLTSNEIEGLCFPDSTFIGGEFCFKRLNDMNSVTDYVHAALSMEFNFRTEADRQRWQNKESFEMYRAAVRVIV
jgi:hypothetical protein